ncbi:hypothetical protein PIB30_105711, partial [Stylosanthes scabra]|nr:hypothetical protein [Stylosanthes scabra]
SVATTLQTSAQNSVPIENVRQDSANNGNGNGSQNVNLGGSNRDPRPRTVNNLNPTFQFGSIMPNSNNQFFPEISQSARASPSNPGVSIQTVRQLIDESHIDLVNLLSQHMTTILNPIVLDTNAKYDYLARQVERVAQLVDFNENTWNQNVENDEVNHDNERNNLVRIVQRGKNDDQVLHE